MGLLSRIMMLFRAKMSRALEGAENPQELLDYSYEKQLELLQNVKRGIVDIVTSRRRLELQLAKQRDAITQFDEQARRALAAGREDLARLALERKQVALAQVQDLERQIGELASEQERLQAAEQRLAMKVEAFRTRKEVIKAQYASAEAQVRIGEAITGLSEEFTDIGLAIQRAEERTERLRARASAIDELTAVGTLEELTAGSDRVERELRQLHAEQSVEAELAALKSELQAGTPPRQLGSGQGGA